MAAPRKTMTRSTPKDMVNPGNIGRMVREYIETKSTVDQFTKRMNKLKADIKGYVETVGEKDDKGHRWLDLTEEVGVQLKVERRVSTSIDSARAERWLKEHGLWDECSTVIPAHRVLDEDKLLALGYDGRIPKKTFDAFAVNTESFAFKTV